MRNLICIITAVIIITPLVSAEQVELFGYYEPQFLGVAINRGFAQLITNKLRVDLESADIKNIRFAANFDYVAYHGTTEWNLLHFVPDDIANEVATGLFSRYRFGYTYRDTIFLDNVFMKIAFPKFDLTMGKQQISLGTGYVWNPTDLFNYKSFSDPTYEQPGHNAIRADIPITNKFNLMLLYGPEKDWAASTKLARIKGGLGHFDFSAVFIGRIEEPTPFFIYIANDYKRQLFGGDFAGELLGLGVWGEFGYNKVENNDNFSEIVSGLDYTLDNGTYILAEYYHNERAKSDYRDLTLLDWLRFLFAETKTISRDNLYLYADYPLTDLIHINNSIVGSLSDNSFALVPGLNYSFRENVDLDVFVNFNTGGDNKAYTSEQGQSGLLRMRIYF